MVGEALGEPNPMRVDIPTASISVVDYPEVDKMVIKNDGAIYQRWYLDKLGENATRKKWEGTYQGFDAADWDQVTAWYKEVQEL